MPSEALSGGRRRRSPARGTEEDTRRGREARPGSCGRGAEAPGPSASSLGDAGSSSHHLICHQKSRTHGRSSLSLNMPVPEHHRHCPGLRLRAARRHRLPRGGPVRDFALPQEGVSGPFRRPERRLLPWKGGDGHRRPQGKAARRGDAVGAEGEPRLLQTYSVPGAVRNVCPVGHRRDADPQFTGKDAEPRAAKGAAPPDGAAG